MGNLEIKRRILRLICDRYVRLAARTPRHLIVNQFENPRALDELPQSSFLREFHNQPEREYLPTASAFRNCDDPELESFASRCAVRAMEVIRDLYKASPIARTRDFQTFETRSNQLFKDATGDELRIGLYLACDMGFLESGPTDLQGKENTTFTISEYVVEVKDFRKHWENRTHLLRPDTPEISDSSLDEFEDESFDDALAYGMNGFELRKPLFDWKLIHKDIRHIARPRWKAGHFADAVEAACKAINERVQKIYYQERGESLDGAKLMSRCFGDKPVLSWKDGSLDGDSMQSGYPLILSGAMTGIRNLVAHKNVDLMEEEAIHCLFVASLLMQKLDQARLVRTGELLTNLKIK